jgi:hypothetical protein
MYTEMGFVSFIFCKSDSFSDSCILSANIAVSEKNGIFDT